MKPPVVHQPVQPPNGQPIVPPEAYDSGEQVGAETDRDNDDVRYDSTVRERPGLAPTFGAGVDTVTPDFDVAPAQERRRH